ncbi:Slp family lipoprotein [Pseudomonadota bacterium]
MKLSITINTFLQTHGKPYFRMLLAIGVLMLQACATTTTLPETLSKPAPNDPGISKVRADLAKNINKVVRWGGTINSIRNQEKNTLIEVVERSLNSSGRPKASGPSGGRFIASVAQFLDPEVYDKGAQITVHGVVTGSESHKIDEHEYLYPVVRVQTLHRWEPEPIYQPYYYPYSPFWYDPWYYGSRYYYGGHHYYPHHPTPKPNLWK